MKDRLVEEPPNPWENYVHHNATSKMALADHWMSSLGMHPQDGTLALVEPEWVFPLGIHPQDETVGDTSLLIYKVTWAPWYSQSNKVMMPRE